MSIHQTEDGPHVNVLAVVPLNIKGEDYSIWLLEGASKLNAREKEEFIEAECLKLATNANIDRHLYLVLENVVLYDKRIGCCTTLRAI